ncbi:MAG: hypothetical protein R3174_03510, partial [Gammaproteobacteria bacterium]|nr:hypothetical protein [Gammaproteobacteria bacterium]
HVDFRGNERAPEFLLRNVLTGHAEGARLAPAGLEVSFRERHGMPPKQELLTVPDGAIVDAGFDRFIESNWEALVRGDTLVRPFLVPSRLQFMDFRIRRVEVQGGREGVVFRLSIDSLLLGLVAPDITVVYDTSTRTLVEYVGVSNMRDAEGNNQDVRIRFGDRRNLTAALEGSAGAGVSSRSDTGNPSRP